MPKYIPEWAYGRFRIVPDRQRISFWNVQEKGWLFWHRWIEWVGHDTYQRKLFASLDDAKYAIDQQILEYSKCKVDTTNIKGWRKTKPVDYP